MTSPAPHQVLEDPENGVAEDKLRLFLIFFLSSPAVSEAELEQYSAALQAAGADLAPLTYLRWASHHPCISPCTQP